jgi:hypothetical protein
LEGFGAFAPFRKILGKRINIGSEKKVFTAERYNKWREFSMAVKAPGASSGGDSPSVDNAEVLIAIEELRALFVRYVLPFSPRIASRDIRGKTSGNWETSH